MAVVLFLGTGVQRGEMRHARRQIMTARDPGIKDSSSIKT